MTAVQHNTTTDSLAEATRALESAERGDLAMIQGKPGASAIRVRDSGMPWLLDPLGHNEGPAYVTTAYLAVMGYRLWGVGVFSEKPEAPAASFEEHVAALEADGWTAASVARALGLDVRAVRRAFKGEKAAARTREQILTLTPGEAHPELQPTTADRLEDLEFLLDAGVEPEPAARRADFPSLGAARRAAARASRADLTARMITTDDSEED